MASPSMSFSMFSPEADQFDETTKSAKYQFDYFDGTPEVHHFSINAEPQSQQQLRSSAESEAGENSSAVAS